MQVSKVTSLLCSDSSKMTPVDVEFLWHPLWSLPLLHRAAASLVELELNFPTTEHLQVLLQMPQLRRLSLIMPAQKMDEVPGLPTQLEELKVSNFTPENLLLPSAL